MTEIVSSADAHVVDRVVAALDRGGTVVLPTDTVYGLAARADRVDATHRLFELKGRAMSVPIAVLCATTDQALALADDPHGHGARLAASFWPGPLTLVLPRRRGVQLHLGEPADTVGLRVPDHELIGVTASRVGPLATTSANPHGEPTASRARRCARGPGRWCRSRRRRRRARRRTLHCGGPA